MESRSPGLEQAVVLVHQWRAATSFAADDELQIAFDAAEARRGVVGRLARLSWLIYDIGD